jgi:hypothetical protein
MNELTDIELMPLVLLLGLIIGCFFGIYCAKGFFSQLSNANVYSCIISGGQYQADGEALFPNARCNYGAKTIIY